MQFVWLASGWQPEFRWAMQEWCRSPTPCPTFVSVWSKPNLETRPCNSLLSSRTGRPIQGLAQSHCIVCPTCNYKHTDNKSFVPYQLCRQRVPRERERDKGHKASLTNKPANTRLHSPMHTANSRTTYWLTYLLTYLHAAWRLACILAHINAYIHKHTNTYVRSCIHTYIHTCVHRCVH